MCQHSKDFHSKSYVKVDPYFLGHMIELYVPYFSKNKCYYRFAMYFGLWKTGCDKANIFLFYIPVNIDSLEEDGSKYYQVSCSGTCGEVSLDVTAKNGDPDLYYG